MVIDIEFEFVPLGDYSQRVELLLRSVKERKADREVQLALAQAPCVDRSLEPGTDDLVEDLERRGQPHPAYNA